MEPKIKVVPRTTKMNYRIGFRGSGGKLEAVSRLMVGLEMWWHLVKWSWETGWGCQTGTRKQWGEVQHWQWTKTHMKGRQTETQWRWRKWRLAEREDCNWGLGRRLGALKGKTSFELCEQDAEQMRTEMGKTWRTGCFWNPEQKSQDLGKDELGKTEEDRSYVEGMNTKLYIFYRIFLSLGCLSSTVLCHQQMYMNPSGKPPELGQMQSKKPVLLRIILFLARTYAVSLARLISMITSEDISNYRFHFAGGGGKGVQFTSQKKLKRKLHWTQAKAKHVERVLLQLERQTVNRYKIPEIKYVTTVVVFPPLGMHYMVGSFHGFLSELRTGQFICLNIKK